MSALKPYLVNVPVSIKIWIRPEFQRKQFNVIKEARPSILFVISDGGRNENEWKKIKANRKIYDEEIDWDCTVYKYYAEENNGLYRIGDLTRSFIWDCVDRCIFLEDDIIPAVSFFRYCAELLEKYKDDERISTICGRNNIGTYDDCSSDYFFSREGSIWGYATWKRTREKYDLSIVHDHYTMSQLERLIKRRDHDMWRRLSGYTKGELVDGHPAGSEFFLELFSYAYNQLQIIPQKNMICNIGVGNDAMHSDEIQLLPKAERKWYNQPVYEMSFPMKHPQYIFPDEKYEMLRNDIMAYNRPLICFKRKIERALLLIKHGKTKKLIYKTGKLFKKPEVEK